MFVTANQLLLINTAMHLPISSGEPPKPIRLPNTPQPLHHLIIVHLLCSYKIIQHLTLVDKCQNGSNGARLARQERVAAPPVDYTGYKTEVCEDGHCEDEGEPEGMEGLLASVCTVGRRWRHSWVKGR
jgi:hypothetical protein